MPRRKSPPAKPIPAKDIRVNTPGRNSKIAEKLPISAPVSPVPKSRGKVTIQELSQLFSGLKQRAHQLLDQDGNKGAVQTTELALSGLRRQKRESQPWSALHWQNHSHFFAAAYGQMVFALRDRIRARRRRPDRENAGNLASEFLAPFIQAGALRLADLTQAPGAPTDLLLVIAKALTELKEAHPELAETLHLVRNIELSQAEVARLTGVSDRTVRSRVVLAEALLAEALVTEFPQLQKFVRSPKPALKGKP